MVKSYLKYEQQKQFGVVCSSTSNAIWAAGQHDGLTTTRATGAGNAIVAGDEEVLVWDLKKGDLLSRWRDPKCKAQVTAIARSKSDPDIYAVGYGDGSIRLWDSRLATILMTFNGHKSSITTLAFDNSGIRLASGSQDNAIIIWDLVSEIGRYKLKGHKNQITGLVFLNVQNHDREGEEENVQESNEDADSFLLSLGKDALLKLWDLRTQTCIETHVAQSNGECWALALTPKHDGCMTAGNDGELKVWTIDLTSLSDYVQSGQPAPSTTFFKERGTLYRQGKSRTIGISFRSKGGLIAVHGTDKAVEIFRIRSEDEVQKSLARKRRRRREKAKVKGATGATNEQETNGVDEDEVLDEEVPVTEYIIPHVVVRTSGGVRSIYWTDEKVKQKVSLLVATTNNFLEVYQIESRSGSKATSKSEAIPPDYESSLTVDTPGHRTDVRSLAISSDDRMLSSAANGTLKIWNVRTTSCIRTLDCGYALSSAFLPGDKIVVVGNKNGDLELFDIASSTQLETVKAHDGPIWTLHVHPDGKSMVTGSADKTAKFWKFEIVQEDVPGTKRTVPKLALKHTRTIKVSDDILSIKFSPDTRLVALALLDNTIKVFFVDSLKLFLNLYGHKLPVLNMDISYDSKLLVSCSADKNIRIWGLDFGDCHKALFGHQDSIMQVGFVPHNQDGNGHHFFSVSKDRMIKYWDGDKFEQIQRLDAHHGEIWALAVSRTGEFIVSASHDKTIRLWQQTDEQIFLEEEREKELEELYESTLLTSLEQEEDNDRLDGEDQPRNRVDLVAASKQTSETLMAGERIMEALELGIADLDEMEAYQLAKQSNPALPPPQRNIVFTAYGNASAEAHVLSVVSKIPAANLQDALHTLTFKQCSELLRFIAIWIKRSWNIALTSRVLFFILRTHQRQIVAARTMRVMLDEVRSDLRGQLGKQADKMGFNVAALNVLGGKLKDLGQSDWVDFDEEALDGNVRESGKGKKRSFLTVA